MKLNGLIIILCLFQNEPLQAQRTFKGFDLYGTSTITIKDIEQKQGSVLNELGKAYQEGNSRKIDSLKSMVIRDIHSMGKFAQVVFSPITYFSEERPVYVTIDIVEEKDKEKRLSFLPTPAKHHEDPDSLIYIWKTYSAIGAPLMQNNQLDFSKPCPAFHCLYGFSHPSLQTYASIFNQRVPLQKDKLKMILKEDSSAVKRNEAAYLLAHIPNGTELVQILLPSIKDPSFITRNSVMRVLSDIAQKHPEIDIPLEAITDAVNFPVTSDRNKSLAILNGLLKRPGVKEKVSNDLCVILINLLKLQQPNNHSPAYFALKEIAGTDYGENNYTAWENWLKQRK